MIIIKVRLNNSNKSNVTKNVTLTHSAQRLVSVYAATPPERLFEDPQQKSGTPPVTPHHTSMGTYTEI